MAYVLLVTLLVGLLLYLRGSSTKAVKIGEMLLFSAILAISIALAPSTIHLLQRG